MVLVKVSGGGTVPALPRALGAALGNQNLVLLPAPHIPTLAAVIFIQ